MPKFGMPKVMTLPGGWQTVSWVHTEKYFRNLIKSNRNQIVFTIYRLIWNSKRKRPCAAPNQSENVKYNLILI